MKHRPTYRFSLSLFSFFHCWFIDKLWIVYIVHILININLSYSQFIEMRVYTSQWASRLLSYHTVKRQVVSLTTILNCELLSMFNIKIKSKSERHFNRMQAEQLIVCVVLLCLNALDLTKEYMHQCHQLIL
jgi:hypothetical protein